MPEEEGKACGSIFLHFCFFSNTAELTTQQEFRKVNPSTPVHLFPGRIFSPKLEDHLLNSSRNGVRDHEGKFFFSLKSKIISYVNNQQCSKNKKRYPKGRNIAKIELRLLTLLLDWPTSYNTDSGNLISAT